MNVIKNILRFIPAETPLTRDGISVPDGGTIPAIVDNTAKPVLPAKAVLAPDIIAQARIAICNKCENNSRGQCRVFACCSKNISATAYMALERCPAGHWQIYLPPKL